MAVHRGLGRGISSLIPTEDDTSGKRNKKNNSASKSEKNNHSQNEQSDRTGQTGQNDNKGNTDRDLITININDIEPNANQPRKNFDEDALQELADSIKTYGLIEPIIVAEKNDYYEIIAGERRWRAARLAGLKEVPVVIRDYSDQERMEVALIENLQREDLNPIEEAEAYQTLITEYGLTQDQVADRVSKSRTAVTNSMRLLKLSDKVREMVVSGMISAGHARTLLPIKDENVQYEAAITVFDEGLSVRDTEALVRDVIGKLEENEKNPEQKEDDKREEDRITPILNKYSENLKDALGTKVRIKPKTKNGSRGKIEIEYSSSDDLERIVHLFLQEGKAE